MAAVSLLNTLICCVILVVLNGYIVYRLLKMNFVNKSAELKLTLNTMFLAVVIIAYMTVGQHSAVIN